MTNPVDPFHHDRSNPNPNFPPPAGPQNEAEQSRTQEVPTVSGVDPVPQYGAAPPPESPQWYPGQPPGMIPPGQPPHVNPPPAPPLGSGKSGGSGRGKLVVILVVVAVLVLAAAGGTIYWMRSDNTSEIVTEQDKSKDDHSSDDGKDDKGDKDDSSSDDEDADNQGLASRPTKFGAWAAGPGRYQAKWGAPQDDGGSDITEYQVSDCEDNELTTVKSNTLHVSIKKDSLACMSVQAVNENGAGETATFEIENND